MFFRQFETFDPVLGNVPSYPFSMLPEMASRARLLLKERTKDQIISAANGIDWAICEYFRTVKEEEIERLREELTKPRRWKRSDEEDEWHYARKFFNFIGDDEYEEWVFNLDTEDELDIPTEQNTSEVDALKNCINWWDDIGGNEFPDEKPYELFAVLSLWLLADSLEQLVDTSEDEKADKLMAELNTTIKRMGFDTCTVGINISRAVEYALKAMDAVCYAKHLQEIDWLKASHVSILSKIRGDYLNEQAKQQEDERQKRSMKSEQLNLARHRKRNEAMSTVLNNWEKEPAKFPSAEKAGLFFADWLLNRGFDYTPRTVTGWIRGHAKKTGVRLR
jgi:hypothetical protein